MASSGEPRGLGGVRDHDPGRRTFPHNDGQSARTCQCWRPCCRVGCRLRGLRRGGQSSVLRPGYFSYQLSRGNLLLLGGHNASGLTVEPNLCTIPSVAPADRQFCYRPTAVRRRDQSNQQSSWVGRPSHMQGRWHAPARYWCPMPNCAFSEVRRKGAAASRSHDRGNCAVLLEFKIRPSVRCAA